MISRQALLLEGAVTDRQLTTALKKHVPAFTGLVVRFERRTPAATWLRFSDVQESSGAPLRDEQLLALSQALAKKRRVWAIEAMAGTASFVKVTALDEHGATAWTSKRDTGKPLVRAQGELLGANRPLEIDLSTDDLLTPGAPWTGERELSLSKPATDAALVQVCGPLKYADREPAIVRFVKARGVKATEDRTRSETRLIEQAVALLNRKTGWAMEPLVLRDKTTGEATGEVLLFGEGFSLWHFVPRKAGR